MNAPMPSTGSRVLDEIAAVIGREAALALARALGGQRLYVPRNFDPVSAVVAAIGADAAAELARTFFGTHIELPLKVARREIVIAAKRLHPEWTANQLAAHAGVSRWQVFAILRHADDRQGDLFGGERVGVS